MSVSGSTSIKVSSPGRICLFGEHQDYLGLPVIAAAVNLRASFKAEKNNEGVFRISMPDIAREEVIDPSIEQEYRSKRDYLRSAVNVLRREGFVFGQGYDITLTSDIPNRKGCSSSSAILVAWVGLLSKAATKGRRLMPEETAFRAYYAEVKEFKEPGGMMDHYTSALGGLVYIETKGEISLRPLGNKLRGEFILGDSLVPKDTTGILGAAKGNALGGMSAVRERIEDAEWETLDPAVAEKMLEGARETFRRAVAGNLRNRDITREALRILDSVAPSSAAIGALLSEEHKMLSENLGISTPRIDKMAAAAVEAGAWGAKINGSGGGGCMFAYAPESKAADVAAALEAAGGKAVRIQIDSGLKCY